MLSLAAGDLGTEDIGRSASNISQDSVKDALPYLSRNDKIKVRDLVRSVSAEGNIPAGK